MKQIEFRGFEPVDSKTGPARVFPLSPVAARER